ncbi:MAG TPA: APC family permease [Bryobacteraceae bacterium]|jgi:amino acid transporter|nr:APC family permease [Bryobacteraceae bacterium]
MDRPSEGGPQAGLRRQLGLPDLALAQVLCVVGSSWVGIAAKLGRAHVAFWLGAMLLFYVPLAVVVIWLNRMMPLEGGLYQWAKAGFGEMAGFLTAWNLWLYAVIVAGAIIFVVPTDLAYMIGPPAAWLPASKPATLLLTGSVMAAIALAAVRGLDVSKWVHNIGSILILLAYAILLTLPLWSPVRPAARYQLAWAPPQLDWFSIAIFGQMTVGALSGFEYVAILAGECRNPARTIGQSVIISAPVICLMFILGTSSVLAFVDGQPINVIGPIPQTMRAALGSTGVGSWAAPVAIGMVLARAIAAASLIFTGLTRLPMTAGWDHLTPAWFARLDPRRGTPINSILFVAVLVMALILLSMLGVREQEASQLLANASIAHYALAYVGLFALPLLGRKALRAALPAWVRLASLAGLGSSLISLAIAVYPIVDVTSRIAYAAKICAVVLVANGAGVLIYRWGSRSLLRRIRL